MEDLYNHLSRYKKKIKKLREENSIKTYEGIIKIRKENKQLVLNYLEFKEQDLKDIYGTSKDAETRNAKTLYKYLTTYLANIIYWFNDVSLKDITQKDIESIYRKIENGTLKSISGKKLSDITLKDIYSRVLKSGFFDYIKKSDLARNVIKRKVSPTHEVRFFDLDTLKEICNLANKKEHRLAYWLLYDLGLEISALLQLKKSNFELKYDKDLKTKYYMVHIAKDISKKGRRVRNNYVHFEETTNLLKVYLGTLKESDKLFNISPPALYRALQRSNKDGKFRVKPNGEKVTIKDFRSSCATYFLSQRWSTDEVKGRLGHSPSSSEINKYVNYLGLHQKKRRKEDVELNFKNMKSKYDESQETIRMMKADQDNIKNQMEELKKMVIKNAMNELNKNGKKI
ncbi:site-specific integrase [archaeon]|jgi:hypothetical protein|nr:site-specific integrase [archaeon]MBT7392224.1 site-specific integrase [archaeon]